YRWRETPPSCQPCRASLGEGKRISERDQRSEVSLARVPREGQVHRDGMARIETEKVETHALETRRAGVGGMLDPTPARPSHSTRSAPARIVVDRAGRGADAGADERAAGSSATAVLAVDARPDGRAAARPDGCAGHRAAGC